jgi:hypothetical protein
MRQVRRLTKATLAVAMMSALIGVYGCGGTGSSTTSQASLGTMGQALSGTTSQISGVATTEFSSDAGGTNTGVTDQQQASGASTRTIVVTGTVVRSIEKSAAGGPLSGDETIIVNGSMVLSQNANEPGWLVGVVEAQVTFIGVQKVKSLGNFNATWSGSASMGNISVQPGSGQSTATTATGQTTPKYPFTVAPSLAPWNGGAGTISLNCTGSGMAEYKGNSAPMPEEWNTTLSFVIWVSMSGQVSIEVTDPNVKSGGLTASYQ